MNNEKISFNAVKLGPRKRTKGRESTYENVVETCVICSNKGVVLNSALRIGGDLIKGAHCICPFGRRAHNEEFGIQEKKWTVHNRGKATRKAS